MNSNYSDTKKNIQLLSNQFLCILVPATGGLKVISFDTECLKT